MIQGLAPFAGGTDKHLHLLVDRCLADKVRQNPSGEPVSVGIPNIVTTILASYRGYDTLGEVTVIFTAGIGVLLLLGTPAQRGAPAPGGNPAPHLRLGRRRKEAAEQRDKPAGDGE